jgi:hypothetical protein
MIINRRGFMGVLAGLIAAPAIVRCETLMPVSGIILPKQTLQTVFANSKLIKFRQEIYREYIRENLFSPYMGPGMDSIIRVIERNAAA